MSTQMIIRTDNEIKNKLIQHSIHDRSIFVFQVLADTDAERTFTKELASEIDREFTMFRLLAHTGYKRVQSNILSHAKHLES